MEMDPILHLRYLTWSITLVLDAVKQLSPEEYAKHRGSSYGGIQGTLEHIYQADMVWFSRLAGEPFAKISDVPVPASFQDLEREWLALLQRIQNWMSQLQPHQFGIEIRYSNSQGVAYSTPIWQIVLHLVNHSTYHRGQVITMLRQAGMKAPTTDLIVYYRSLETLAASTSR